MTTTANKIDPYYPIHPGEIIKDELEFRGISQRKLADRIGVSHTQLNEILNCKRPVSSEIEAALGLEPEALVDMQTRYNLQTARRDPTLTQRLEDIRNICASQV